MLSHRDLFTHRHFDIQTLLHEDPRFWHTEAFTHRPFYDAFYTQTLLHTNTFTHRLFQQTFWHRDAFTDRHTDPFTHRLFYTQTSLHRNAFTHRPVYTQTLLHRHFYTQALLHTDAFTQKHLDTEPLLKSNGNGRFGNQMETAVLGQSLARSLLEPDFGLWRLAGQQLGIKGKGPFLAKS